jgi:uncharacterized membrane protein YiaA
MRPSCRQLILSWVLFIGGTTLMGQLGHPGFFFAVPMFVIVQRIRQQHDRDWFERYKQRPIVTRVALCYYLALLAVTATAVMHHRDPMALNFVLLVFVFLLPLIVGVLIADHAVCSSRSRGAVR